MKNTILTLVLTAAMFACSPSSESTASEQACDTLKCESACVDSCEISATATETVATAVETATH